MSFAEWEFVFSLYKQFNIQYLLNKQNFSQSGSLTYLVSCNTELKWATIKKKNLLLHSKMIFNSHTKLY